jgi:UDP-3-O-[3-hydroxymyristoyl] glucosamine N-acyltransferase
MISFKAQQIAALVGGRIVGNPDTEVGGLAKIEEAKGGDLAFLANPKYEMYLPTTGASIILLSEEMASKAPAGSTLIIVANPYDAFATLLEAYQKMQGGGGKRGIEQPVFVAPTAKVAEDAYIGAFTYVGEGVTVAAGAQVFPGTYLGDRVFVGANTVLHAGVKVYADCTIGANCIVHAGVVIGSDGFGFAPQPDGSYKKVPQTGNVVVEDYVEIGANTTIDRATMGATRIRSGAKIDNLVQLAHNVEIGSHTVIAAQAGISGSTHLGKGCMVGGQVGIVGHLHLADGTRINAQSGVTKSTEVANSALNGSPAFDYRASLKSAAVYRNLPDLEQRLKQLEQALQKLQG